MSKSPEKSEKKQTAKIQKDDPAREDGVVNEVDEAAYESFPASDPPSFTRTTASDGDVDDDEDEAPEKGKA